VPQAVSNTSPLLYLHRLGQLDLLHAMLSRVLVPEAVVGELVAGARARADVPVLAEVDWIEVRAASVAARDRVTPALHAGEREALALALEIPDAIVVVDDGAARREAAALGLRLVGTVGVLVLARQKGLVPAIAPLLDTLVQLGFRLDHGVRAKALRLTGERVE
jgi:predicted nucleic acid-binding protein